MDGGYGGEAGRGAGCMIRLCTSNLGILVRHGLAGTQCKWYIILDSIYSLDTGVLHPPAPPVTLYSRLEQGRRPHFGPQVPQTSLPYHLPLSPAINPRSRWREQRSRSKVGTDRRSHG